MPADLELTSYYALRAQEYERIYDKPERQEDLKVLRERLPSLLANRSVYEVACGTGYWTQTLVPAAAAVFATDVNEEVLALARAKPRLAQRVTFAQADAFSLPAAPYPCDAGLAAFWWSHLRRDEIDSFLQGFFSQLTVNARFAFVDNVYAEGSSIPINRTDADGNTYQQRRLSDGSVHEVLKNFPSDDELKTALSPYARTLKIERLPYYWLVWGDLP
jgi:SAM-dependent methyltransferase